MGLTDAERELILELLTDAGLLEDETRIKELTTRVKVEAHHIKNGGCALENCPIALALRDAGFQEPRVVVSVARMLHEGVGYVFGSCRSYARGHRAAHGVVARMPPRVGVVRRGWD